MNLHRRLPLVAALAAAGFSLLAAAPVHALPPGKKLSADIRQRVEQPNYRHHIIAIDEHGSALLPQPQVTKRDGGKPVGWRVTFDTMKGEDTTKLGDDWRTTARQGFVNYLEGIRNTRDAAGDDVTEDGLFENYRRLYEAGAVDRVVIHIHGGLNLIGSAAVKACEVSHAILADRAYPIFVVWKSNLFGTYGEHLFGVRDGVADRTFSILTSPLQIVADAGTAISRFPLSLTKAVRNDLYQLNPELFQRYQQANARYETLKNEGALGKEGGIQVSAGLDYRPRLHPWKKAEDFQSWLLWAAPRAATTPVIDTLGTAAWFNMLRRTRVMFERESSFVNLKLNAQAGQGLSDQEKIRWLSRMGALRYFFERAQSQFYVRKNHRPAITLIGHSMGAIVAGEILARFPGITFENVVFMAAASTVNDFKIKVVPYLDAHPTRFYNLCLHSFNDAGSREPVAQPEIAPRGSLLVWIDSMFDKPVAEDDRTMGRWENAIIATDWLPGKVAQRTTIKAFGRDRPFPLSEIGELPDSSWYERDPPRAGRPLAEPQKHGQFGQFADAKRPSYRFWRPYYWTAEPIEKLTPKALRTPPAKLAR